MKVERNYSFRENLFQRGSTHRHLRAPSQKHCIAGFSRLFFDLQGKLSLVVAPSQSPGCVASCSKEGWNGLISRVHCVTWIPQQQSWNHPCTGAPENGSHSSCLWFLLHGDFMRVPAGGLSQYPFSSLFSHLHSRG